MLGAIAAYFAFIVEHPIFHLVAELGFLYLMFLAGLEIDLKKLFSISPTMLKKSLLYNVVLFSTSFFVTLYFYLSKIFIVIFPLISIGVLAALKKEYGDTEWIKMAFIVGLIGEIVSIFALTTVSAVLEYGLGFDFYKIMVLFLLFIVTMIIIYKLFHNLIWWFPEIKNYLMPEVDHQEQDIRISMAIFFLMITVMMYLHLEIAFGAFIAGIFITTFFEEHNKQLPHKLEHFGFGWLVPIFFISVGASLEIDALLDLDLIIKALLITFVMIIIRLLASLLFKRCLPHGRWRKKPRRLRPWQETARCRRKSSFRSGTDVGNTMGSSSLFYRQYSVWPDLRPHFLQNQCAESRKREYWSDKRNPPVRPAHRHSHPAF